MGLKGSDAQIYVTDKADSTTIGTESLTDTGDGLTWYIGDRSKHAFDPATTIVVEVDSGGGFSPVAASTFTVLWTVGAIVFDSSQSGNSVQITGGSYLPKHQVSKGFETEVTISANLQEITQFGDDAMRHQQGLKSVDASFGTYEMDYVRNIDAAGDNDGPTMKDILLENASEPNFIFQYYPDDTNSQTVIGAFVMFSDDEQSASPGDAQTRTLSMQVDSVDSAMATQPPADVDILSI